MTESLLDALSSQRVAASAGVAGTVAHVGLAWMRETPNRAATSVAGLVLEVRGV